VPLAGQESAQLLVVALAVLAEKLQAVFICDTSVPSQVPVSDPHEQAEQPRLPVSIGPSTSVLRAS
jgi:hypothetical protein